MLEMYMVVTAIFSVFTAFFFYRVKLHYEKHGSIFPVVRFLAGAAALFFIHLILEFVHLWVSILTKPSLLIEVGGSMYY